jgi:hypothetical protein
MSAIVETIGEMAEVARDMGASLMRLVAGARMPIDNADASALSELKAGEGRKQNDARNDSAGNADAR